MNACQPALHIYWVTKREHVKQLSKILKLNYSMEFYGGEETHMTFMGSKTYKRTDSAKVFMPICTFPLLLLTKQNRHSMHHRSDDVLQHINQISCNFDDSG